MELSKSQRKKIKADFSELRSIYDLLNLLNKVKSQIYGKKSVPFELKQLTYYSNPSLSKNRYKTFSIPKKSGGSRTIHAPFNGLKLMLRILNEILISCSEPHKKAYGFVRGKSIVDNALIHSGKKYVFNIDLKDFFYSFNRHRIKLILTKEPFNLNTESEPLAFLISCLCTHPIQVDDTIKIVLPQGSPVSPVLTNVACIQLDRRLNGLAKKIGAKYSRYADDITFSSDKDIFYSSEFQNELTRIIEDDQKLKINHSKTRLQESSYRQEVTGLTVNVKPNVSRRFVKQLRMWIYYWEQYGYEKANNLFNKDYLMDKGHVKSTPNELCSVLHGKLQFLRMVKGKEDSTFVMLHYRYVKLLRKLKQPIVSKLS
jgi:RNA-directed DNA polymerase